MHENLSNNKSKDVCESEFNIVHKTLWQNNSADVPDNAITELKEKGVGNRSGFQYQSKVTKIQKGKVCHRKCQ